MSNLSNLLLSVDYEIGWSDEWDAKAHIVDIFLARFSTAFAQTSSLFCHLAIAKKSALLRRNHFSVYILFSYSCQENIKQKSRQK